MKAGKKLHLFDKVMLTLNVVAALAILLSYLASSTDPRDWWFIAVLGFGYHYLVMVNVLFIIYWVIRLKLFVVISLFSILIGFPMILANYGFNGDRADHTRLAAGNIRVMTYNVHKFEGVGRFADEPIHHEVTSLISELNPDIISFEEFGLKIRDKSGVVDSLKKIMESHYYYFKSFKSTNVDSTGNAIFSKFPIIAAGIVPSPDLLSTRAVFADIKYKNKVIRMYSLHLAAVDIRIKEKARFLKGDVSAGNSNFILNRMKVAFIMRSYDVSQIKRHMEECPYPYIVSGDFNDTPNSFAVNEIGDGLKNAFIEKGSGFVTTYYSQFPKLQIDYILVSQQFDVVNYRAIDRKASDHKPIVSDVKLVN